MSVKKCKFLLFRCANEYELDLGRKTMNDNIVMLTFPFIQNLRPFIKTTTINSLSFTLQMLCTSQCRAVQRHATIHNQTFHKSTPVSCHPNRVALRGGKGSESAARCAMTPLFVECSNSSGKTQASVEVTLKILAEKAFLITTHNAQVE